MSLDTVLSGATVRPCLVGLLDIKDDPVYGWTGPGAFAPTGTGDTDLDDNTFLSAEGAVQISDFVEDSGIGAGLELTFAVSEDLGGFLLDESELDVDPLGDPGGPVYDQLVQDRRAFMGRPAIIWLVFLDTDETSVLADFERVFDGVMVAASSSRQSGQQQTITLGLDQDLQKARWAPARVADHQAFNPGDTFSTFGGDLSRGPVAGAVNTYPPGGITGSGPGGGRAPPPKKFQR